MKENQIAMVVETLGSEGACAYLGEEVIHVAGRQVKAVGIPYQVQGMLSGVHFSLLFFVSREDGKELQTCECTGFVRNAMEYGNISGCICVQSKGAIDSLPTRETIEAYIRENK